MNPLAILAMAGIVCALAYTRQPALPPAIHRSGVAVNQSEPVGIANPSDVGAQQGVYLPGWLLAYTSQKGLPMRPSIAKQTVRLPRLRDTRVPWSDLEDAVNCSVALGHLLGTYIVHSLEDGTCTNVATLIGIESLTTHIGQNLHESFDVAHSVHNQEREI